MPILHNYYTDGQQWQKLNVNSKKVIKKNKRIEYGSKEMWEFIKNKIENAIEIGILKK